MKCKLILSIGITMCYGIANATLGGGTNTVSQDYQVLNTSSKVSSNINTTSVSKPTIVKNTKYDIYTFVTNDGTTVRQYVNNGKVFAIKWSSKKMPNLKQLYGDYFTTYVNAKASNTGMSQNIVNSDDFSAVSRGISGAYSGYAVLNSEMPTDLTISNLK